MTILKRDISGKNSILLLLLSIALITSCTAPPMVAVVRPQKTKSAWKNRLRVYIKFSSKNLLENRLAIINAGKTPVSVYPVDVTLEIPKAEMTLPAVLNFNEYVSMRYNEAKKRCVESAHPKKCLRYVSRFFKRYNEVNVFQFGEIPSRKKETGYFAFNLPDPFNESAQSKKAGKLLKNKGKVLRGTIRVAVHTMAIEPEEYEFIFPVRVVTSSDEKPKLLRIMKYY